MPQTFDFSGIAPAPADQAPPVGLAPMTFATVNKQRVPIDDTPDDTEPTPAPPPAAAPTYNFEGIAPAKPPAPPPEPSLYEKLNTSPLHPYFEAARKAVTQAITQAPGLDLAEAKANDWTGPLKLGTVSAMGRGAIAGGLEGVSKIAESFTTPTGFALWLTGLGAESAAVKAIPALKPLIALPAIQNLRAAVHGTAGAAFAAHGAGTAAGGLGTLWDAATSAQAPPEGRWGKALSGLGDIGQGTIEAATGILGVHGALEAPAVQNWQQARRTAAGAAAMNDFRLAAPPSVAAPYSTEQLQRAFPELIRDHLTNGRITTIDENISAADNQIGRLETGFNKLIDADRSELIKTKPLDAVNAALANVPRSDALAKGLKNLETLGLDRPLTVYEANQARIQLNAENDATLANNKYDVSIARKVDPAFAAREAAVASLRQGVHDVLDPRAQQTPGFTRDLRLDEGALIAVRNALLRQKYHNEATVGGSGVTSGPRRIGARALELGVTGAGAAIGGSLGAAGGPAGAAGGAVGGSIIGKELGSAIASTVNKPPISRDALIERAFSRAGALVAPAAAPTAPGGPAFPPPATPAGPGLPPPGGGPGGPGGPGGGPGLPPAAGPTAGMSPREIGVGTFLALRARGLSREQAVQSAASYVRSLPGAPEPRALPPAPPKLLGAGPRFVTDAAGQTVPIGQVAPGALIPDNGARVPTMPEGGYQRPPGRDRSSVKAVPGTYAERLAAVTAPEAAPEAATIAPDAAPAVAPESAPAARAGLVAPGGGPELPAAAGERVLAPAERTARARARAADRADARAAAAAEESQGLADLVTQAQAAGYAGDPAALRAELADRLQGIKELHAELDQSGTNGLVLLRALADNGGLSEQAAEYDGAAGELRTLKELRDTAPSTRANAGNLAKRRVLDTVRGVKGVFREDTQRQQGGFAGGQSLDSMVEKLAQDPRFYFIKNADDLSEAIHTAATGRDETRNALKDLAANSHDLIGTATHYPEDDLSFDPAALEAESQAHAAATPDRATVQRGGFGAGRPPAPPTPPPEAPPPPAPAAPVSDVLDTGELQGRLPGAGAARQVGKADVSLRAPVQASGEDFSLETPLTDEQRAADAAKAKGPSLFGDEPAAEAPAATLPKGITVLGGDKAAYTGKSQIIARQLFHEVRMLEGAHKGELKVTPIGPDGTRAPLEPKGTADTEPATAAPVTPPPAPPYHNEVLHVTTPEGVAGIRAQGFDIHRGQGRDAQGHPITPGLGGDHYGPGIYLADYQRDTGSFWRQQLETKNFEGTVETDTIKGTVALDRPFHYEYDRYNKAGDRIGNRIEPREALAAQRPDLLPAYDAAAARPDASDRTALGAVLRAAGYDGLVIEHRAGDEIVAFDPKTVTWDPPKGQAPAPVSDVGDVGDTPPAGKASSTPAPTAPGVSINDIPLELAQRAHAGTSMVPEKRADAERAGYVEHMNSVWADLIGRATTPEQRATAAAEFARYRAGYLERTRAQLSQRAGLMSTMITGPSNFPAARMNKKNAAYDKGVTAFVEWNQRARKAMIQAVDPSAPVSISADRPDAPDALQAKIDKAVSLQAHMTAANKIVRMKGVSEATKVYNLEGLGLSTAAARALLEPDFANRLGYPDYELTNNRANIRRMQARIADIGTERARPAAAATFDGGTIEENTAANRIQVTFDAKPDATTRATLKANGFKWSPSQEVWQRQRTQHARDAIQRIFKVKLEPPPE